MYYILAILAALLLSAFQYLYKRKALWLFLLRFLTYAVILLLLINPKVEKKTEQVKKPDLYVLTDNTFSIKVQNADGKIRDAVDKIRQSGLNNKFNLHFFKFDTNLTSLDSLSFKAKQTDISKALSELSLIHQRQLKAPVLLLTDGQATTGQNYIYQSLSKQLQVYPLIVGDTNRYEDIKIDLLNVNPYAYQGNRFPVEVFLSSQITKPVRAVLKIMTQGQTVYKKAIQLSPEQPSRRIETNLKAGKSGLHSYKAVISGLRQEKNTLNNQWHFTVEVIDNAQKVLIVSDIIHPDIGAVKRSLNRHKYIKVENTNVKDALKHLQAYRSFILYQPTENFVALMTKIKALHKPWLIITGKHTDWSFINRQHLFFSKQAAQSFEAYFPIENKAFSLFKLPALNVKDLPPLYDTYGQVHLTSNSEIAYFSKINNITTNQPLIAFNTQEKQAVILGENLWQWGMQAGLQHQKEAFDQLLYQSIQYLSLQKDYDRLKLHYKKQYYQGSPVIITAQFLDENLQPDLKQNPVLITGKTKMPMRLSGDFYQADLSRLTPGEYRFIVQNADKSLKKSGYFQILPFSLERVNAQANLKDLNTLAQKTGGQLFFDISNAIKSLTDDHKYKSVLNYQTKQTPLIDFKYLLFLLVLLLSLEWFVKKIQGQL